MDNIGVQLAIVFAILILGAMLVASRRGETDANTGFPFVTWLALTLLTMWCEAMIAFAAVFALYFALGAGASIAGFIASGIILVVTPFAWRVYLRRRSGHPSGHA